MFLPWAKCSHLFWNCWWKIDKSKDRDGDRRRKGERQIMRRRSKNKFLVSRHGFQNGVGVVGVWGLWKLGRKIKRETNGRKDEASLSGGGMRNYKMRTCSQVLPRGGKLIEC